MIIHKPQATIQRSLNDDQNNRYRKIMEQGTEMLYTETNCFVKLKSKEIENIFHLENESSNVLCQKKFDINIHPNNTKFILPCG